jgi:hypothetical protein
MSDDALSTFEQSELERGTAMMREVLTFAIAAVDMTLGPGAAASNPNLVAALIIRSGFGAISQAINQIGGEDGVLQDLVQAIKSGGRWR